jgi:predicted dehydrogenase
MTLPNYPGLIVVGVTDRNQERGHRCGAYSKVPVYKDTAAMLADPSTEMVVNLTNPDQHYVVSRAILEAGKSVYSEKPLAMTLEEAEDLVAFAEKKSLCITSAPWQRSWGGGAESLENLKTK